MTGFLAKFDTSNSKFSQKISSATFLRAAAISSIFIAAPNGAHAEVVFKQKYQFFKIAGRTGAEIMESLVAEGDKISPAHGEIAGMGRALDITGAEKQIVNGKCMVTKIDMVLSVTYYLPKWQPTKKASQQTRQAWTRLSNEIVRHEKTHAQIQHDGVREIEKEIKRISGTALFGCRDYALALMTRLYPVFLRIEQRHAALDRADARPTSKVGRMEIQLLNMR